jgi:hypothetical protein
MAPVICEVVCSVIKDMGRPSPEYKSGGLQPLNPLCSVNCDAETKSEDGRPSHTLQYVVQASLKPLNSINACFKN